MKFSMEIRFQCKKEYQNQFYKISIKELERYEGTDGMERVKRY